MPKKTSRFFDTISVSVEVAAFVFGVAYYIFMVDSWSWINVVFIFMGLFVLWLFHRSITKEAAKSRGRHEKESKKEPGTERSAVPGLDDER